MVRTWPGWPGTTHRCLPTAPSLRVATLGADGTVVTPRTLLGGHRGVRAAAGMGRREHAVRSDRPQRLVELVRLALDGGAPEPLHGAKKSSAPRQAILGQTTHALLDDGRLAVTHGVTRAALGVLDPRDGTLVDLEVPFPFQSSVRALDGGSSASASPRPPPLPSLSSIPAPARWTFSTSTTLTHPALSGCASPPPTEALPGPDGRVVRALVHPPTHPMQWHPRDGLPPYVVFVHGGPTARVGGVDEQGEGHSSPPRHRRAGRELCRLQRLRPGLPQLSARAVGRRRRRGLCRRRTGPSRRRQGGRGAPGHPAGAAPGLDRPIGTHPAPTPSPRGPPTTAWPKACYI